MPKRVDHEQRRQHIAHALWRIASTRGLRAVSLREVAAEAGVSMRLVQYYFRTKDTMLRYTFEQIGQRSGERMASAVAAIPSPRASRDVVRAYLVSALPTDEDSRVMALLSTAYYAEALTDRNLAVACGEYPLHLADVLADELERAARADEVRPGVHPRMEAGGLANMVGGLSSSVLLGFCTSEQAVEIVEYHVDRLFRAAAT